MEVCFVTDNFYTDLLTYISLKAKQQLCAVLQKNGVRIKGFRLSRDIPSKILANYLARNEVSFHKLLIKSYKHDFNSKDEAVQAFSPDNAIMCLTYFLNIGENDEEFFLNLISSTETKNIKQEEIKVSKEKKKSDEFRNKYIEAQKNVIQLEKQLVTANNQINQQEKIIKEYEMEILSIKEEIIKLNAQNDLICNDYRNRILELESIIVESSVSKKNVQNKIVVIQKDLSDMGEGVCVVCYDQIGLLYEISHQYSEILFVANELPFPVKRQIYKIQDVQNKFHVFKTKSELQSYIEKRSTY